VTAYTVFTRLRRRNQAELDHYGKQAASFLAGHEIKWLAPFGRPFEVVEGPGAEGVALLEFPTLAAARACNTSPAYQKASEHRFRGGDYGAMIVDGAASERLGSPTGDRPLPGSQFKRRYGRQLAGWRRMAPSGP